MTSQYYVRTRRKRKWDVENESGREVGRTESNPVTTVQRLSKLYRLLFNLCNCIERMEATGCHFWISIDGDTNDIMWVAD